MAKYYYYQPEPYIAPVRVITTGAMQTRFSIQEEIAINTSTDAVVGVLISRLFNAKNINLDLTEFTESLAYIVNYLDSVGVLEDTPSERISQLLVDGTDEEKYLGDS